MEEIQVKMFGGLSVRYGDKVLVENGSRLNKPLEFLALLLQHRDHPMANDKLMDRLWENDEIANPAGALKNTAYTIRRQFQQVVPGVELILTEGRSYLWNPAIPTSVDLWHFEEIAAQLAENKASLPRDKQLELCREATSLYAGDFLPSLSDRQWVVQRSSYLRQTYLSVVRRGARLLLENGRRKDLEETLAICNRAVMLEPLSEDLYLCIFRAMQTLDMKSSILSYYPIVSNLFLDELGVNLPEEARSIYLWASSGTNKALDDINQIRKDLDEATRDARPVRGAFCCQYEVFKQMYQMIARNASRDDNSVVLMLLTLVGERGCAIPKTELSRTMLQLKSVVEATLRKGDVFSRYSRSQFILMLSVKKPEDCSIVELRLREAFRRQSPPLDVKLAVVTSRPEPIL